jgi:hypothetical protein
MNRIDDLVMVPIMWLPNKVLRLLKKEDVRSDKMIDFFTDELSGDGDIYYIDTAGRLIIERIKMSVMEDAVLTGVSTTALVCDIKHNHVMFPSLEKVYCEIRGKRCTLELSFDDGLLSQVNSIIV